MKLDQPLDQGLCDFIIERTLVVGFDLEVGHDINHTIHLEILSGVMLDIWIGDFWRILALMRF